jgi:tetratricopeptide (TPR) repeat protein
MRVPVGRRSDRRPFLAGLVLGCVLAGGGRAGAQGPELPAALATRFAAGVAALQGGSLDQAEAIFRAVLQDGGDRAFVHHNLGIVLQQRGRHAAAVAEFHRASALDPAFGPARLLAGSSLIALGRPAEALVDLERAVTLMPREIAAHLQLADACERTGRVARLTEAYRAVVALAPDDPEYVYRLGKAYLRLSQQAYGQLRAVEPKSARLSQALGQEYVAQGQPQLARQAYEAAAARDPGLAEVHLALARLHADGGRWDDAAREIALELAVQPASREALALRARIVAARSAPRP